MPNFNVHISNDLDVRIGQLKTTIQKRTGQKLKNPDLLEQMVSALEYHNDIPNGTPTALWQVPLIHKEDE